MRYIVGHWKYIVGGPDKTRELLREAIIEHHSELQSPLPFTCHFSGF